MIELEQSAELVQCTPDAEQMLERIARVCYNSEDRMACEVCSDGSCADCAARRARFLGGLRDRKHDSIFEHASATFRLVTDRGISHELVRHRLASYTQASTRYIKYLDGMQVVRPLFVAPEEEDAWRKAMLLAEKAYLELLAMQTPPQNARDVLPTCAATIIFVTANFREWRHILRLRLDKGSHPKIRVLARLIWEKITPLCPVYFSDLAPEEEQA